MEGKVILKDASQEALAVSFCQFEFKKMKEKEAKSVDHSPNLGERNRERVKKNILFVLKMLNS